ncbi:MAG: hypothetical protein SGI92_19355 [Bryobacteraceae bacterium]|nr:hypothetical protein [Bryobacteraceae bacterium]
MLKVRDEQLDAMGEQSPGTPNIAPCKTTASWIEFQLLDKKVPGEQYKVKLPDRSTREGLLDKDGKVRFEPIIAGQASISFPGFDEKEWRSL